MAEGLTMGQLSVEGLPELLKDIDQFGGRLIQLIDYELLRGVQNMVRVAKRAAPKNFGNLAREITYKKSGPLSYEYISGAGYSAYQEFGTKGNTNIPAGLGDFAAQFKGSGFGKSQLSMKQAIFEWARHVGIEKKFWYLIYRSILIHGVKPHPFFFPIFFSEGVIVKSRIENIINNAT